MKTITINNVNFEEVNRNTKKGQSLVNRYYQSINHYGLRTLWEVYTRPSRLKEDIFHVWLKFFISIAPAQTTIVRYNSNQFIIGAIANVNEKKYLFYISKLHNYIIDITED